MESDATLLLISRLSLEDIKDVNNSRKGKAKEGTAPTDEEIAFQLQAEALHEFQQTLDDARFCRSLDSALDADQRIINAIDIQERAANEDRAAALALERDSVLPKLSETQRALERLKLDDSTKTKKEELPPNRTKNPFAVHRGTSKNHTSIDRPGPAEECIACGDKLIRGGFIRGACNHCYCSDCFIDLVRAALNDESLHPLRCCNQAFNRETAIAALPTTLAMQFKAKAEEFDVPPNQRIYCPKAKCSAFQGSTATRKADFACASCYTMICPQCKQFSHAEESCAENVASKQVRELARSQGWQTCPRCQSIVELAHGCYHMTCRCRQDFCYVCAAHWKNCTCPQWDEGRLVTAAEQRAENELGARAQQAPAVFQRMVQNHMTNLRQYHDCSRHSWSLRHGGGVCEECYKHLPNYLLMCRTCRLLACVRCSRNRL